MGFLIPCFSTSPSKHSFQSHSLWRQPAQTKVHHLSCMSNNCSQNASLYSYPKIFHDYLLSEIIFIFLVNSEIIFKNFNLQQFSEYAGLRIAKPPSPVHKKILVLMALVRDK